MKIPLKKILPKLIPEKVKQLVRNVWLGLNKYRIALFQLFGMIIIFLIIINVIFYFISSSSSVCNLCHYMNPYYKQWQKSVHNQVACVECHGNRRLLTGSYLFRYISGTYNPRPRAEVENDVCLKCHPEKSMHTKTAFKMNIFFDHGDHLGDLKRGKKLRCTSCHARGMDNEHFYVSQNVCYTCHFMGAERGHAVTSCNVCHGIPKKIVSHEGFEFDHSAYIKIGVECSQCHIDVISGKSDVDPKKCFSCHAERTSEFTNTQKVHQIHITIHGVDCEECHNQLKHGQVKMISSLEGGCENCHQNLHIYQRQMYIGINAKGIKDTPSRMFAAQVACQGCHIDINHDGKSDLDEKRKACVKCHDNNYGPMLDKWIKTLNESQRAMEVVEKSVNVKRNRLKMITNVKENERNLMENISYNYNLFVQGKGSHNIDYAYKILTYIANSYDSLNIKYWKTGISARRPKFLSDENEYCNLCHSSIPSKEITKFKDRDFPHKLHTSFLKCSNCHSIETHKKIDVTPEGCDNCHKILLGLQKIQKFGEITFPHSKHSKELKIDCQKCHISNDFKKGGIKKESCKECHHQGKYLITDCRKCHPSQFSIYNGTLAGGENLPDVMIVGGIECESCHVNESKSVYRPSKEICSQCHDKSYERMMDEWQKEVKGSIKEIDELFQKSKNAKIPDSDKKIISKAQDILNKVKKDGSFGVHNFVLINDKLLKTKDELKTLIK